LHHTRDNSRLAATLIELVGFLNSPQRDEILLREAGVALDRALFPLLIRLAIFGPLSVAGLADQVGRDHTTISRQLSKLQSLGLIARQSGDADRRVRTASVTADGDLIVQAITKARERLLSRALADWTEADRIKLETLNRRFVDALTQAAARVLA
jgi:DNA-binding MarR family transcriptional regulator